jgi:hypothetical protein
MEFRKALLKAAGLLALTAAGTATNSGTTSAALAPEKDALTVTETSVSSPAFSDPLFDLMSRTNGSFTEASLANGLQHIFNNPTAEHLDAIPNLLANLAGLGVPADTLSSAREVLSDIVASAQNVDEEVRDAALATIKEGTGTFKLAQNRQKDRKRDPDEIGQVRDPDEVGQVPSAAS